MKQGHDIDCENVVLKPWQTLLKCIKDPTNRHVIWIVGEACGAGKTFLQKYVRSLFGRRRDVAGGIHIKSNQKTSIYNRYIATLALSWISAIADNLASLSLQDRATEWHYYWYRTTHPPPTAYV